MLTLVRVSDLQLSKLKPKTELAISQLIRTSPHTLVPLKSDLTRFFLSLSPPFQ